MKVFLAFLIGILVGFGSFMGVTGFRTPKEKVLAENIEASETATVAPSPLISENPSPTPSPTASPSIKPSPKPTIKTSPTPVAPPSLSPSPTPSPIPTATPDVWSPPSMEPLFAQYAGAYGVDKNTLERIANCESHFNPNAVNGSYVGMFQFATSSWISNRNLMGLDPNPVLRTNVEESIKTAAFLLSHAGTLPWPSCV